jgi:hypothetical protein
MNIKVEMEDGSFELVANVNLGDATHFRIHKWGNPWLIATLNDDTKLIDDDGKWMTMGCLRTLEAGVVTFTKTGGEARRSRTFKNRQGVNLEARPFNEGK